MNKLYTMDLKKAVKKILFLFLIFIYVIMLNGCSLKLEDKVTQLKTEVEVGTNVNLSDLFSCEEGISIGFNNADSFNSNKIGSYTLEATISNGKKDVKKNYIVKVSDHEPPELSLKEQTVTLYQNDEFNSDSYIDCSDNSGEKIEVDADESELDMSKAGEYTVKYSATDSSGNCSRDEIKVIVKKAYTYKELKSLVKKILKNGDYDKLGIMENEAYDMIAVNLKKFLDYDESNDSLYMYNIAVFLYADNKEITSKFYISVLEYNNSGYTQPDSIEIKSSKGKIFSHQTDIDIDFDYYQKYVFFSNLGYIFDQKDDLIKFCNIINGDNLQLISKTDRETLKHKCSKSDMKKIEQFRKFYLEILEYM